MAEKRERSAIFKFFYVVLSIVTFPIFMLLYILKHPLLILFLLAAAAGAAAYWPLSLGVKMEEIPSWYKAKYSAAKLEIVTKAAESGNDALVPQALLKEVRDTQKKLLEEAEEAKQPKGENFNAKVVRDDKHEETKSTLKKRGGFKKKSEAEAENKANAGDAETGENGASSDVSDTGIVGGGLAGILKAKENASALSGGNAAAQGLENSADTPFLSEEGGESAKVRLEETGESARAEEKEILPSDVLNNEDVSLGFEMPAFGEENEEDEVPPALAEPVQVMEKPVEGAKIKLPTAEEAKPAQDAKAADDFGEMDLF